MSVRWKPLLVLSGLFVVIAIIGLVAMAFSLVPKGKDILPLARAERTAKRYENAMLQYKRALQTDGKNASIHEEYAGMLADWMTVAPDGKRDEIRALWRDHLAAACNFDKTLKEPRKQLLAEAMKLDDSQESVRWANEVLSIDPNNLDAIYVLASEPLDVPSPSFPDVKRRLDTLEAAKAAPARVAWVKAKLADVAGDLPTKEATLNASRTMKLDDNAGPVDRTAMLRLRALDVESTTEVAALASRVKALQDETKLLFDGRDVAPNRIMKLSLVLEKVQKSLTILGAKSDPTVRKSVDGLVDSIETDVEAIFQKSLAAAGERNLHIHLTYADHLRFRGQGARCLEVVDQALKLPLASQPASSEAVLGLRAVAVEAALADAADPKRHEKAEPHIAFLIASPSSRFQGLGHLFQGAIELEQSGLVAISSRNGGQVNAATPKSDEPRATPKLRSSALNHLKLAAAQLPDVVEAQARYGVALILSQEPNLGRQYLQNALRLGGTDPQYQVWAAWSMVQAGYPEEAEPVVRHLMTEMSQGRISRELEGTIHLLSGEISQARRSPEDLKRALAEYDRSYAGKTAPASVQLRMAQIEAQLGSADRAIARLDKLRASGEGGAGVEQFAVLTLLEQGKKAEAFAALAKARATYPASDELVGLESALFVRDGKPQDADRILSEFCKQQPDNLNAVLMRAQILTEQLDNPTEARRILSEIADKSDNSAPFVQLALLDLKRKDFQAVATTIARIRGRWKEAAAADLLEAQVAIEQKKYNDALTFLDAALKKDPGNKLVQFWKAQIDSKLGSSADAAKTFERIAGTNSTKELEEGLTLRTAAQSALANLSLQSGDLDSAIRQFESLRGGSQNSEIGRADRWQLIKAYVVKGQWPAAKRELGLLLNDTKYPASLDERVRASNFYRENGELTAAIDQLDYVLKINPAHPAAVVTRAYIYAEAEKEREAIALIRKALKSTPKDAKDKTPAVFFLMLAALENKLPPEADAGKRTLSVLEEGLALQPKAPELVQAKYRLLLTASGPKNARVYVEEQARGDQEGSLTKLLAAVCRDQDDLESAEGYLRQLVEKNPTDPGVARELVRLTALEAAKASDHNDRANEKKFNEKTARLIKEYRSKFPSEVSFLQEDCELAFRSGDMTRALAITKEIDQVAKNSTVGPVLRARLYAAQGKIREVSDAYTEALNRNPMQLDVRVSLGQTSLRLGQPDEALRQASMVLEVDPTRADAILLKARALASTDPSSPQAGSNRAKSIEVLRSALKANPKFSAAYQLIAEIQLTSGQLDQAITTLQAGVNAIPDDAIGISQLVELLAIPDAQGKPIPDRLAKAKAFADQVASSDKKGNPTLAAAVGFEKAGQIDLALAYAEKASKLLDTPVFHLNRGDMYLAKAEQTRDTADFEKAVEQYDLVLKTSANSVEAINNKAWILHSYLKQSKAALELAEGLIARVDPSTLPGEFFDTLGAIQESLGQKSEAEDSYAKGLRKSPDHPVLNYHMGRLIVADNRRSNLAKDYLQKALDGRKRLPPEMAAEASTLIQKIRAN